MNAIPATNKSIIGTQNTQPLPHEIRYNIKKHSAVFPRTAVLPSLYNSTTLFFEENKETVWWDVQASNLRLPGYELGVLPTELTPQKLVRARFHTKMGKGHVFTMVTPPESLNQTELLTPLLPYIYAGEPLTPAFQLLLQARPCIRRIFGPVFRFCSLIAS